ncbi:Rap1a/Tai family immunity protein [Emcibacter sp.]|uniref:Rap1a/Tai family immunity protein n=1 Tax=Emcibacter sp. TaxID=1979954 RepID=UPI002AA8A11E|nr:Rap1a/Tai family immunity protein [Emcibacter sp.]
MKIPGLVSVIALTVVLSSGPSRAMEWLDELDLRSQCSVYFQAPESKEGILCESFIQGYLSGIHSLRRDVDRKISKKVSPTGDSFSDRAIRTRAGSRFRYIDPALHRGFCISDDVTSDVVVRKVVTYLNEHPDDTPLPDNKILFNALLENFPCNE